MAETIDRTPRTKITRDAIKRVGWRPASTLPDPDPRPGIAHRWIATSLLGESMHVNVSKKRREGWEAVRAEDYPELEIPGNTNGNVEVGGLMLCAAPLETVQARDEYYAMQARAQTDSVDSKFMALSDPRMPTFTEKKSNVSRGTAFGSGS
jgi:hypothetical protein